MRIKSLNLLAYGPFRDKILDFSGNGYGLHVVYGPNEAGKSTALRALVGFLFGFGHIVEDAWQLEKQADLAVGGALQLNDGRILNLTRHKRRKNDLVDQETGKPFSQSQLDAHLGRVGQEAFRHTFGISHDALRLGVESVLAAGGDLGQALFAATSGLNTLKRVMAGLDQRQNALFAPRAQKAVINAAMAEIRALRTEQRKASASHHQWKKAKKDLDALREQERQTENTLEILGTEISQMTRRHEALKHVAARQQLEKDLEQIGPVPHLRADFSQMRVETQMALRQTHQALKNLREDADALNRKITALVFDNGIIANEKLIEDLAAEASIHAKAKTDSRTLRARIYQHQETAQKALALLRPGLAITAVHDLRLSRPAQATIQRLAALGVKLKEARDSAGKALDSAATGLKKLESKLLQMPSPKATEPLAAALSLAGEYGQLETHLQEARAESDLLRRQAEADLAALGLFEGSLAALERLAFPGDETMRIFENEMAALGRKSEDLKAAAEAAARKQREKAAALAQMTTARDLPSPVDLDTRRGLREKGWASVRKVWLEGGRPEAEFMAAFPESTDLSSAYEESVRQADETADLLRTEAEAVALAETLRRELAELDQEQAGLNHRIRDCDSQWTDLNSRWVKLWAPFGIDPLSPREMTAWLTKVVHLRQQAALLRKGESKAVRHKKDIAHLHSAVSAALKTMEVEVPREIAYRGLVDLAKATFSNASELKQAHREMKTRIATLKEEIDTHQHRRTDVQQQYQDWLKQWKHAVAPLGLGAEVQPEEVQAFVLALEDVFAQLDKAEELHARHAAIDANYQDYSGRVGEAGRRLDFEMADLTPEAAALALNARLKKETAFKKERQLLEVEQRKKNRELAVLSENLVALEEKMRLLCREAHCDDPEFLPDIEQRAAARIKILEALEKTDERLAELALGQDLNEFIHQVKSHDPDELTARLERLTAEKKGSQETLKKLVAQAAVAENELAAVGGESQAVAIAEKAEGLVAKVEEDVAHYMKLRLASAILTQAIERYRQSNQSPVLEAAGGYFKTITRGAFDGLRANYDEKGEPVVNAQRPDGTLLGVAQLSDGSRDQLFLALRLGGLAKYIQNNGPMPFVVDDVLVHFDDERSRAALEAMAGLAGKTQIIFFTHHRHLVELAEDALPADAVEIHTL